MKKIKTLVTHLLISSSLLLASCGYVSDKPVENVDVYKTDELQTCKIDASKLSEIFTSDQKDQIKCLQENFIQFTKYVRSKQPGAVTESELSVFIKRFFENQSETIINSLSLIFQLNMILLKDEADRISNSKITPLFELLIKVNQEAVVITNLIKIMDDTKTKADFWAVRKQFNESVARLATSTIGVIDKSPGLSKKLNMRIFITDLSKKIGDSAVDQETIDSFIFLKRLVIGGSAEVITTDELKELIAELPKVLGLVFDVYYVEKTDFKSDSEQVRFYLQAVKTLASTIKTKQDDFELLNSDQVVKLAEKFFKDYDVKSFKTSIEALKARFIGGKKDSITLVDLKTIIVMAHDFFEKVYFNQVTYANNRFVLAQGQITDTSIIFKQLPEYDIFKKQERLEQLVASFKDTAVSFRYFRDDNSGSAIYDRDLYRRSSKSFNEVNIAKWLSWKLLNAYGKDMQINTEQFSQFLLDAKPLLEEFKLWSPNFQTFSRNAVLLADLFQQQSNGNQTIGINEATEYIGMLLTAVDISGRLSDSEELIAACDPGTNPGDPLFEAGCFNQHFFNIFLNKLKYKETVKSQIPGVADTQNFFTYSKDMPRLAAYIGSIPHGDAVAYLQGVEGFARDDNSPGVPINRRDITLIIGAMINIESTFVRFDSNKDEKIDYDELSTAYLIYRPSIIALAKLEGDQLKYAKTIFLYMASKMEIPKTGDWWNDLKFGTFSACVEEDWCRKNFMDPIVAKRLNIGKLLFYMVSK